MGRPGERGTRAEDAGPSWVPMPEALLTFLLPPPKTFQRRMETLNLRWEELGIKEAQLKAHIQKFEQFIQVPGCAACSRPGTPTLSSPPPCAASPLPPCFG